ncbi:MAG TPA: ABC transporter transmembrane domain-containing protein [Geminicoccus sp.]|jgi:ABC-type multidrug transport system fused ATPase/permease subunit|uniref:ABC transporter transmembrane domain-containing protein n=1 Tax=Geminicoccus sp. TaxID=2024832 RepID=UPI002E3631D4|nr:ABC transporter transmembrane domain-containing protein [Geminicoccus sp.]HEX2524746.1 ABC transporter transmembrane domain-containing protein [Geminicoccus sp.]
MEPTIFGYIRRHSWKEQLIVLAITAASFPFLYWSLNLPKTIVNDALSRPDEPHNFYGWDLDKFQYLFALCGLFLALVLINGIFKYIVNVYAGLVAERMLRRLRYDLYSHILRFPLPHMKRVSTGEVVQMINAETEALGGYIGTALQIPAYQGGTLLVILVFIFIQDPVLGLAAIALYPIQAYFIPKLQRRVNRLGKERIRQVRRLADRISETVSGVRDLRANDATQYERARMSQELSVVYYIRYRIYILKFMIKFINNFFAQIAPFFFFSVGGYLVLTGNVSLGAIVAVLSAHKDLSSPWRELLDYYQLLQDVRIKYDQVVSQFQPRGLVDERRQLDEPTGELKFEGEIEARGVLVRDEEGDTRLDNLSFKIPMPSTVAITGPGGGGREELAMALAGLITPDAGRVTIGGQDLAQLPDSVLGRKMAFVGFPPFVGSDTIEDNLLLGMRHRPLHPYQPSKGEEARYKREQMDTARAGNSPFDFRADWVDWAAAGVEREEDRLPFLARTLEVVQLDADVYALGLRGTLQADRSADLREKLLEVRRAMSQRLESDESLARLVERFDPARYNSNATLAENLLFGAPADDQFQIDRLAEHTYVRQVLDQVGISNELRQAGLGLARTMVELFADLPPDHEFYQQFSFIRAEDLPDYQALVARADPAALDRLDENDRQRLLALPFKLINARHRLGLITKDLEAKILEARKVFRENLPPELSSSVAFFEPDAYNDAASVQDNVLFGKVAYGAAQAPVRIAALIRSLLEEAGLRERIIEVGLSFHCGPGGGRLSVAQRQKLAIARAILRRPMVLVLHDAATAIDAADQSELIERILEAMDGRTVIWSLARADLAGLFGMTLALDKGRLLDAAEQEQKVEPQEAEA